MPHFKRGVLAGRDRRRRPCPGPARVARSMAVALRGHCRLAQTRGCVRLSDEPHAVSAPAILLRSHIGLTFRCQTVLGVYANQRHSTANQRQRRVQAVAQHYGLSGLCDWGAAGRPVEAGGRAD